MKRGMIFAAAAVLLLAGCAQFESALNWATTTTTTPQEANSAKAAGDLYVAAAKAADAFVQTARCTPAMRQQIAAYSHAARLDLDDWLSAEQAGDSAKVKLATDAFNQAYPALLAYLQQNGATP